MKRKRVILGSIAAFIVFAWANIYELGQAIGGHYDWVCDTCRVRLYSCPAKGLKYLEVPATYQAHPHVWRLQFRPARWSLWKPWHWLVYATAGADVLNEPDPATLFKAAYPQQSSEQEGLRRLSVDPQYPLAEEIAAWFDVKSRPA